MKDITQGKNRSIQHGLISSCLIAVAIMLIGGLGFWWIDPQVKSFGDGLWLAFTTAATVGYGDHVPSTDASRAFAVIVVVMGLAVLSLVTASIAALFVQNEERDQLNKSLQALHSAEKQIARLEVLVAHLEELKNQAPTASASASKPL